MYKKIPGGILVLSMIVMLMSITVYAETAPDSLEKEFGSQRFTYINYFLNTFQIESGQAKITSYLSATGVDQVRISVYLQRFTDGYWFPYNNWTSTRNGTYNGISVSCGVEQGYSYRIVSYGYALIGGYVVEGTSYTSSAIFY